MSPGAIVLLRFLIASSCFLLLALVGWVRWPKITDLLPLGMLGLLGHGIYQLALSISQTGITAGTASVLISTVPVFSALLAMPALGERISIRGWMGIAFAFAGVLVVNVTKSHALLFEPMALVGLVAAAASATYFVLQKPWLSRYRAIDLTPMAFGWNGGYARLPTGSPQRFDISILVDPLGRRLPGDRSDNRWLFALVVRPCTNQRLQCHKPSVSPARHDVHFGLVGIG